MQLSRVLLGLASLLIVSQAIAADPPPPRTTLPQEHDYQKQLYVYLATLTAQDFEHGVSQPLAAADVSDPETQYRNFIFTQLGPPLVGSKRGAPAINAPSKLFTLAEIETPMGVLRPPVYPDALISLVEWDYPGNVYHQNKALKLRAFVVAAINLMMLDDYLDKTPVDCRADRMGYQLIYSGVPHHSAKDLLPEPARLAYEAGLKKLARRIIGWGPKGDEIHQDLVAPVGLWYASQACNDPVLTKDVEAYARALFTDPKYFHPAGYSLERGGVDIGFQGNCNFFTTWAALASDWPFAKEAIDKAYRLRAHLILPEPDGKWTGPTHFNTRLSSPATIDQWEWGLMRDYCASLATDEAVHLVPLPNAETLAKAGATRASEFNRQIAENPVKAGNGSNETPYEYFKNDEIGSSPWGWRLWANFHFPASINFGHEFYPRGAYAHRQILVAENSPLLKSPFLREEHFIRDFGQTFTVARQASYAAIVHTGTVGDPAIHDKEGRFQGPLGLGGGQLSAFWTPATGSVIMGRRAGMGKDKSFDKLDEWRQWPIHAVSGITAAGKPFTSARIIEPEVTSDVAQHSATVAAVGDIPADQLGSKGVLTGRLNFGRAFLIEPDGVRVVTQIHGDGRDQIAELYETIPVFLRDVRLQPEATPTKIEFQIGGAWQPASDQWTEQVTAARLTRFGGAVEITFDEPRRVKLSSGDWSDTWFTLAACRNILIDLLEKKDQAQTVQEARVGYRIQAVAK